MGIFSKKNPDKAPTVEKYTIPQFGLTSIAYKDADGNEISEKQAKKQYNKAGCFKYKEIQT